MKQISERGTIEIKIMLQHFQQVKLKNKYSQLKSKRTHKTC